MKLRIKVIVSLLATSSMMTVSYTQVSAAGTTPTSISAESRRGTGTATIEWATNSATGYRARIKIGNVAIKTSNQLSSSATSYTFTGLEYGVPYSLEVQALSGTWSSYGLATPNQITPTAAPPSAPAQPTVSVIADKKIKAEWALPASNGGSPISTYSVQLKKGNESVGDPVTTTSLQIELDVADTTSLYSVTVAAINEASVMSDSSPASSPIAAEKKAATLVNLTPSQGNSPTSGGSGNSPTSGGITNQPSSSGSNQLVDVVASNPNAIQTPPNLVSPLPALLPYSKLVKLKSTTSKSALSSLSKLTIPKGAATSFVISTASKKYCSLRGTSVYMFKTGTCAITFTVKTKTGKKTSRTVKLVVR